MSSTLAASRTLRSISAFGCLRISSGKARFSNTVLLRVERVVLEHHRDVAVLRVEVETSRSPMKISPRGERDQPGDQVERRGLAAAGGADQRDELAVLDREGDVVHGRDAAVGLVDVLEDDLCHRRSLMLDRAFGEGTHEVLLQDEEEHDDRHAHHEASRPSGPASRWRTRRRSAGCRPAASSGLLPERKV